MKRVFNHLKENWIKYGFETFVVIAGVLIAFTLSDWNEQRNLKKKEIELLQEVRDNLKEDVEALSFTVKQERKKIGRVERLIKHLEAGLPYHDSLVSYIRTSRFFERFEINTSAFETMKSSGFERLSSQNIKKLITNYYDVEANHRTDIVDRLNVEQRESIMQYERKHWETYNGTPMEFYVDMSGKDRYIINYLYDRVQWKEDFINDMCLSMIDRANLLIELLEEEISTLQG